MTPEVQRLLADEALGVEVERFLSGEAGKRLIAQLEHDRAAAVERLVGIDAEDPRAIRAIQNEIAAIDRFQQGLGDMLTAARGAIARLDQLAQDD